MKESHAVKSCSPKLRSLLTLGLLGLLVTPPACKDKEPCDEGQESIGTGCFPVAAGGSSAGGSSKPEAGSPSDAGAADGGSAAAPAGNPDATFATPCETDADCGGDAPVCATDPLFYCTQLNCKGGEENADACPEGWTCLLLPPNPSACVNLATAP